MLFLMGLAMSIGLTSCVTTAQASDDLYDEDTNVNVVISYGTPIIVDDMIAYYYYRGWYYYPHWVGDTYYFHRYRRVLPPDRFGGWYRPIPRHFHRPNGIHHPNPPRHHNDRMRPHIDNNRRMGQPSNHHNRPTPNINRGGNMHRGGSIGNSRPMVQPRSSTRNSNGGGHFGGSRMGGRR